MLGLTSRNFDQGARLATLVPKGRLGLFFGLLVAVTAIGCGHEGTNDGGFDCYFGEERQCTDDNGCSGVSTCERGRWTACVCTTARDPIPASPRRLGNACSSDAECVAGALCLLPNSTAWFGGGPPKGLCVADCSSDEALCSTFEASVCVSSTLPNTTGQGTAFCMPTCGTGQGTTEAANCSLVPASACDGLEGEAGGFCRPFCRLDSDCRSGHCDRRYGSCVALAAELTSVGFGQSCETSTPNCDGVCLNLSSGHQLCSQRCIAGDTNECTVSTSSQRTSVCAYQGSLSFAPGNLGYCAPLCDCNDDCVAAGFVCKAFGAGTATALGRAGLCYPNVDSTGASQVGLVCSRQQGQ